MNSICIPAVKEFIVRHRKIIFVFLVVVLAGAAFYGMKKMKAAGTGSLETEWEEYRAELDHFDNSIRDVKDSLEAQREVVATKQAYVDNAVYMKLDPEAVNVGTVQYAIAVEENVSAGNVLNALVSYARDGGLMADALALTGDEEVKFWQEVLTIQGSGANFSLTTMQYSEERAKEAIAVLEKCVDSYVPKVKEEYGGFTLDKINETFGLRSDVTITNGQNNHRNDLRSHLNTLADLETKIVTVQTNKENFIKKEQPVSEIQSPVMAFAKGFASVLIVGVAALCVVIWFVLRFDGIIRGVADAERYGCTVFGTYRKTKGFDPEAARIAMDVELVSKAKARGGVYIADLGDEKESAGAIEELSKALREKNFTVDVGHDPVMKAECLEHMVKTGQCILFVRCGLTRNVKIQEFNEVCKKYDVDVTGTIAVI